MIELKCPKCGTKLEIDEHKVEEDDVHIAVFCSDERCSFNKIPLIGLEKKKNRVFISESIV